MPWAGGVSSGALVAHRPAAVASLVMAEIDYAAVFYAWRERHGLAQMVCPSCHKQTWAVQKPAVLVDYLELSQTSGNEIMPVLPLLCLTCGLVQTFVWIPIQKGL
jgi:hypothetical protein